jgi:hypothetical protein
MQHASGRRNAAKVLTLISLNSRTMIRLGFAGGDFADGWEVPKNPAELAASRAMSIF